MSESKKPWHPLASLSVALLVVVGIPWSLKLALAPKLGAPCAGGFDCAALQGRCIKGEHGHYCTVACESDDECPSGAHCGVPKHDPWWTWFSKSPMSPRFCVPGTRADEASVEPGELPGARPEAQFGRSRASDPHAAPELVAPPQQTH